MVEPRTGAVAPTTEPTGLTALPASPNLPAETLPAPAGAVTATPGPGAGAAPTPAPGSVPTAAPPGGPAPAAGPAGSPERTAHDLLVALAGRLPDRLLWRLRDWLAAGAVVALRTALPHALLRHRVALTEPERALLRAAVVAWGGSPRLVDSVLRADDVPQAGAVFAAHHGWDTADLVLRAVVPALGGVAELRRSWRTARATRRSATPAPPPARVVLVVVRAGSPASLASITGTVQRTLRAQGETDPRVEVIGPGTPITSYHRDAVMASQSLWRAPAAGGSTTPDGALPGPRRGPSAGSREDAVRRG